VGDGGRARIRRRAVAGRGGDGAGAGGTDAETAARLTVPRPRRIALLSLSSVVTLALAAAPARGYVRKKTDGGIPEYWQVSCLPTTIYTYGFLDMTIDEITKAVGAAAHSWSPTAVTCADGVSHPFVEIVLEVARDSTKPPLPAYDGHNTVIFFTENFPPPQDSPIQLGIVALTSVFARADGHIVDADLQINAIDYDWANRDPGYEPSNGLDPYDLQNAVTHEFGHFQGLGHTCWAPFSDFEQPIDDKDAGVPLCESPGDSGVDQTVMFATIAGPSELTKRTLSADDIRAVCSIYPSSTDPHSCTVAMPDDGCGCSASAGAAEIAEGAALLALAGIATALRRRAMVRSRRAPRADRG